MCQVNEELLKKLEQEHAAHIEQTKKLIPLCPTGHEEFFRKLQLCSNKNK